MPLCDQDLRKFLRPNGVKAGVVVQISHELLFALQYLGMNKGVAPSYQTSKYSRAAPAFGGDTWGLLSRSTCPICFHQSLEATN